MGLNPPSLLRFAAVKLVEEGLGDSGLISLTMKRYMENMKYKTGCRWRNKIRCLDMLERRRRRRCAYASCIKNEVAVLRIVQLVCHVFRQEFPVRRSNRWKFIGGTGGGARVRVV